MGPTRSVGGLSEVKNLMEHNHLKLLDCFVVRHRYRRAPRNDMAGNFLQVH